MKLGTLIYAVTVSAFATTATAREPIVMRNFDNPLSDLLSLERQKLILDCRVTLLAGAFANPRPTARETATCRRLVDSYDQLNDALREIINDN